MPGPNSGGRTNESRLDLLEWRAASSDVQMETLRKDMNDQLDRLDKRLGRILIAGWTLIASVIGGAAAMVISALVLRGH